jgi:hypothetical protein
LATTTVSFDYCSSQFRYCGYLKDEPDDGEEEEMIPPGLNVAAAVAGQLMRPGGSRESKKQMPAIVIFFSNMGLCTMRTADEISIDGTFSTAPAPFKQIVFVQAKQAGRRAVPVVFALLSNKVLSC